MAFHVSASEGDLFGVRVFTEGMVQGPESNMTSVSYKRKFGHRHGQKEDDVKRQENRRTFTDQGGKPTAEPSFTALEETKSTDTSFLDFEPPER